MNHIHCEKKIRSPRAARLCVRQGAYQAAEWEQARSSGLAAALEIAAADPGLKKEVHQDQREKKLQRLLNQVHAAATMNHTYLARNTTGIAGVVTATIKTARSTA